MTDSAFIMISGVLLAALGGAMGGSFYVPFSRVKQWACGKPIG